MKIDQDDVKILSLGEIIFWHEEILNLVAERCINFPHSTEAGYNYIGFKPMFYSIHLATVNDCKHKMFAFTEIDFRPRKEYVSTKIISMSNNYLSRASQLALDQTIGGYVNDCIYRVVKEVAVGETFSQAAVAMQLLVERGRLEGLCHEED